MLSKETLGLLAVIFSVVAGSRYIWDVFEKRTKPHVFSWLVWGLFGAIVFFAQRSDAAGPGSWALGVSTVICFLIALLAVRWGEKTITKSDVVSFIAALFAIALWCFTGSPLWSVMLAALIDTLGYYPTFRKSWLKPNEETAFLYSMDALMFLISLGALETYSLINVTYPLTIAVVNIVFVTMLFLRRRASEKER
jgi:hypothetical protein